MLGSTSGTLVDDDMEKSVVSTIAIELVIFVTDVDSSAKGDPCSISRLAYCCSKLPILVLLLSSPVARA